MSLFSQKKNVKHFNNDEELIVDLEIEKGFKNSNDQRFLNYAKILVGKYAEIKIMVLALVITPKIIYSYINKGSEILFQKNLIIIIKMYHFMMISLFIR